MSVPGKGAQLVGQKRRLCDERFGKQGWASSVCFGVHFPPPHTRHKYEADNEGRKRKRPATPLLDSGPVSAGSPVRGGVVGEG